MAIYESSTVSRADLERIAKNNVCLVCGCPLWLYNDVSKEPHRIYLSCSTQSHQGIKRDYRPAREKGILELKGELEKTMTTEAADKLTKYTGARELAKHEAKEIIESLFPQAPAIEQERAILTCVSYRLNPLAKHVFLIPFKRKFKDGTTSTTWALVMGIKAKRLLANRPLPGSNEPRPFSYIDDTPRVMTEEEQRKIFGQLQSDRLNVITKLQDPKTGAVAVGYGFWMNNDTVYGTDKGNTAFNMAAIRSEAQAIDRLRPGEMPETLGVVDERVIADEPVSKTKVIDVTAKAMPQPAEVVVQPEEEWDAIPGEPDEKPPTDVILANGLNLTWFKESLISLQAKKLPNWSNTAVAAYLAAVFQVEGKTLTEMLEKLTKDQVIKFVGEVSKAL